MISGNYFKYNNISFKPYGLYIGHNKTSFTDNSTEGSFNYTTGTLYYEKRNIILGRELDKPLSFDIEIFTDKLLNPTLEREISNQLINRPKYCKLEILSKEYKEFYWNCILQSPTSFVAGSQNGFGYYGYKATVLCDAPWGYEIEKTLHYNFTSTPFTFNFICISDNIQLMIPKTVITIGSTGGTISLTNLEDNSNVVQFTSTVANEIITIDKYGQVSSSTGNSKYSTWNKNRLYMIHGDNHITVSGNIASLDITYQNVRRLSI